MKQICEVVRDLLWLYEEGECSEGTRQFVESHLEECEECRRYQGRYLFKDKRQDINWIREILK